MELGRKEPLSISSCSDRMFKPGPKLKEVKNSKRKKYYSQSSFGAFTQSFHGTKKIKEGMSSSTGFNIHINKHNEDCEMYKDNQPI
jgi:hypothetical protein